jgi:hypothetical protein
MVCGHNLRRRSQCALEGKPNGLQNRKVLVNSKSVLKQKLAAGGGVAISLKKADKKEMKGLKKKYNPLYLSTVPALKGLTKVF